MNMPSNSPGPVIDIKDPRIRVTFADVAMRVAHDGPMYGVILLVGILAMRGNVDSIHAIIGAAFALQARSRPPETDKLDRLIRGAAGAGAVLLLAAGGLSACMGCAPAHAPQGPAYCYDETLLKVRYATCVKHAATRSESDACADDVDAACGWAPTRGAR